MAPSERNSMIRELREALRIARGKQWWPERAATVAFDFTDTPIARTRARRPPVASMATDDGRRCSRVVTLELRATMTTKLRWSEKRRALLEEFLTDEAEFFGYGLKLEPQTVGSPHLTTAYRRKLRYRAPEFYRRGLWDERASSP